MSLVIHVNEVQDDDASQIAQPQLPGNRLGRLQVGFENGVVKIASTYKSARVDVHRCQRFSLVNDQVPTRLEVDPPGEGPDDLLFDVGDVKKRALTAVMRYFVRDRRGVLRCPCLERSACAARVNQNFAGGGRGHVSEHTFCERQILMQKRGGWKGPRGLLDTCPECSQVLDIRE